MKKTLFCILLGLLVNLWVVAENYPYRNDYLWVGRPDHADWNYRCGEQVEVEIELYEFGVPVNGTIHYTVAPDMLEATEDGQVVMRDGKARLRVKGRKNPGFTTIALEYTNANGKVSKHHLKVGFDTERIQAWTKEPKDMMAWWQKQIDELHRMKLSYTSEDAEELSTEKVRCQLLKIQVDKQHSIYAYLFVPREAKSGSCPAVLCPPGAGIKTIKDPKKHIYYAEQGMIRMEMEIHGLDPRMTAEQFKDVSAAFNAGNSYFTYGLENKERYYMKHVYLSLIRALDLLTSLDEWDGKNLMVQGNSQGGALSIVAAALDERVTACAIAHPALSDMGAYSDKGRTGGYPHFNKMGLLNPMYLETMAYYDVVNFARHIHCPVWMTWGYCDNTCPPTTSWAVYNTISSEKTSLITPINEHWVSEDTEKKTLEWLKEEVR